MGKVVHRKKARTSKDGHQQPSSSKRPARTNNNGEIVYNFDSDLSSEDEVSQRMNNMALDSSDEQDTSSDLQWNNGNFIPIIAPFNGDPGIQEMLIPIDAETPFDYFQLFFDEILMQLIADETNRYQSQNPIGERQHMSSWKDVTLDEIYVFFAITMLTGLIEKNRIEDYWSTDPLKDTPIFREYFARDRYKDILRYLHFVDNENPPIDGRL
uniref:PiggyBac transposable element-derived protein domain-containing protein n=1 Tax=Acrobeloides nanus TaxID=290746 RepID=A0A914DHD3_9BILA